MSRNNDRQILQQWQSNDGEYSNCDCMRPPFCSSRCCPQSWRKTLKIAVEFDPKSTWITNAKPNYLLCLQPFLTDLSSLVPLQSKWQSCERITMGTIVLRFKARTKITTLCRLRRLPKLTIVPWRLKQRKGLTTRQREKKAKKMMLLIQWFHLCDC